MKSLTRLSVLARLWAFGIDFATWSARLARVAEAAGPLANLRTQLDGFSPALSQLVMACFMEEGHFSSHLRRMRSSLRSEAHRARRGARAAVLPRLDVVQQPGWLSPSDPPPRRRAGSSSRRPEQPRPRASEPLPDPTHIRRRTPAALRRPLHSRVARGDSRAPRGDLDSQLIVHRPKAAEPGFPSISGTGRRSEPGASPQTDRRSAASMIESRTYDACRSYPDEPE